MAKETIYLVTSKEVFEDAGSPKFEYEYKKSLDKIISAGVPAVMTGEEPFDEVFETASKLMPSNSLIISNNGAFARTSSGKIICNNKIPSSAISAISVVLQQAGLLESGNLVLQTLNQKVPLTSKNSLFQNIKERLLSKSSKTSLQQAKNNAYNLNFEISSVPRKELRGKKYTRKNKKGLLPSEMWQVHLKNESEVKSQVLNALLNADESLRQLYEPFVDITLTKGGIGFVPKGCSKLSAVEKYAKENSLSMKNFVVQGNSFSDLLKGVSLEKLAQMKAKAEFEMEDFDADKAFYKSINTCEELNVSKNMQTYFLSPHYLGRAILNQKISEFEKTENDRRETELRKNLLKVQQQIFAEKERRQIGELEKNIPRLLEDGTENEEFILGSNEIKMKLNEQLSEIEKQINATSLPKQQEFHQASIDGSNYILAGKIKNLAEVIKNEKQQQKESEEQKQREKSKKLFEQEDDEKSEEDRKFLDERTF